MIRFLGNRKGFTLIEIIVTLFLFGLLMSATAAVFKHQLVLTNRIGEEAEMRDNLRTAAYWLARDIRGTTSIVSTGRSSGNDGKGPGPGIDNAFKIKVGSNIVSYYYRNDNKTKNVFYRDQNNSCQPLSSEYFFGGTKKGYITSWEIFYFDANNTDITNTVSTASANTIKRVEFVLYGSYPGLNNPNAALPFRSSATIRANITTD